IRQALTVSTQRVLRVESTLLKTIQLSVVAPTPTEVLKRGHEIGVIPGPLLREVSQSRIKCRLKGTLLSLKSRIRVPPLIICRRGRRRNLSDSTKSIGSNRPAAINSAATAPITTATRRAGNLLCRLNLRGTIRSILLRGTPTGRTTNGNRRRTLNSERALNRTDRSSRLLSCALRPT